MVLDLYQNLARPVFMVENKHYYCLLDTGALFPVWCSKATALRVRYPDSYKTNDILPLSGFGGRGEKAPVYIIPEFRISKEKECIVFQNFPVAVSENVNFKIFNMIIPAFLFRESLISLSIEKGTLDRLQIDHRISRPMICKIQYLVKNKSIVSIEGQNVVDKVICFTQFGRNINRKEDQDEK